VAPPAEVIVTHRSGEITVALNSETVVVMDVGILLSLDDLGIDVAAVGALPIPIPDEFDGLVNNPDYAEIGTAFEPDLEAINALEPDLIIVVGRSSRQFEGMSPIAPAIDLIVGGAGAEVAGFEPGSRFRFVYDLFGYTSADPGLEQEATHGDFISSRVSLMPKIKRPSPRFKCWSKRISRIPPPHGVATPLG